MLVPTVSKSLKTEITIMDQSLLTIAFSVILALVGWLGSRMMNKLDILDNRISTFSLEIIDRVGRMDGRIAVLESRGDQ